MYPRIAVGYAQLSCHAHAIFSLLIEIRPMTAGGHFLYSSSSKSLKYDLSMRGAISFTIPYQNHTTARGIFLYNSLSKSSKYDLWLLGAFPLQFLIKIIKIWPMTAMGNFLYNSLSKSLKYDLWMLRAISFTIPNQNRWNMTYDC